MIAHQIPYEITHHVSRVPGLKSEAGCAWWNLACQGGQQIANSGLHAITKAVASGANMLLGEIVKTIDQSTRVPLSDPDYREVYAGFLGLAAPLIGVVLLCALIAAAVRRDPSTLGRAVVGIGVASLGGALYIVMAQLLVALDDYLAQGIVRVTGQNLEDSMAEMAEGFQQIQGVQGEISANAALLVLMVIMLFAALILWFVLVFRKVAILVVVAFAPLLIAGYLWAPTRPWVRRATQTLVALVFTKSAIFALFGIGLALMNGSTQSLSDFVGATVLMCGACFAPLVMLRLVHFAADSNLAGDMMGTLRTGVQPVTGRIPNPLANSLGGTHGRKDMARTQAQAPTPAIPAAPDPQWQAAGGTAAGAAAAGATGGGLLLAKAATDHAPRPGQRAHDTVERLTDTTQPRPARETDPGDRIMRGPTTPNDPTTDPKGDNQ